jgi:hypothetical protein
LAPQREPGGCRSSIFSRAFRSRILCAVTVALSLLAGWLILGGVRMTLRLRGWDQAKPVNVPELATITSVLFALLLSFSAAGVWNDWQQAQGAVRREALALENVLGLANGLPAERAAKLKERVVAYAEAAAKYEWPAMAYRADMDDPVFKALDAVLAGLTIELSSEIAGCLTDHTNAPAADFRGAQRAPGAAEHGAFLDLRSAVVRAGGIESVQVSVALIYNYHPRLQILAVNVVSLAAAAAFYVRSRTIGRSSAPSRSVPSRCCNWRRKPIGAARFRRPPAPAWGPPQRPNNRSWHMTPTRSVGWHVIHLINR